MAGPEPKRPRMAFEGAVDMPDAATLEYATWAHWRNVAGSVAMSFMEAEDIGVMAANFQMRVTQQGLSVAGVDRMCQWATPDMDQATALAHMAMYEKAEPYVLDVAAGRGSGALCSPATVPANIEHASRTTSSNASGHMATWSTRRYVG